MAKALIVGATGLPGKEMLIACKKQVNDVHALIRPSTRDDPEKMKPLEAAGAIIHEGDLEDYDSLLKSCKAVDNVISVVNWQSGDERTLVQAVKDVDLLPIVLVLSFFLVALHMLSPQK